MGSCIICGTSVEGHVCESHQEDVAFEFEGSRANQLTSGRFYRGEVDGFAEFGVFIDIGDSVTGLLHRSELDQRLESLDWDAGETVYVQVTDVHDNGNVDLAWSIRQAKGEFRGALVDDPEGDRLDAESPESAADGAGVEDPNEHAAPTAADGADATEHAGTDTTATTAASQTADTAGTADTVAAASATDARTTDETERERTGTERAETEEDDEGETDDATRADTTERERATIDTLDGRVGDAIRIEGEVTGARQTGGPTVFEVRDESGTVECAAFESAGVRAYPEVEVGDAVGIRGTVERHRDALQVEVEALSVLAEEDQAAVTERLETALTERAAPEPADALAEDPAVEAVIEDVRAVASAIRRAIIESRPIVVRHAATAEGYVAGAAIERAVLALLEDEHASSDAAYHYFDRRPLAGSVYGMDDATKDTTRMLGDRERHDEALPLVVFAAAGSTRESADGLELLSVYGAERAVIDSVAADPEIEPAVDASVTATDEAATTASDGAKSETRPTAAALAANVAAHVDPDVRADVGHLPAVSYWDEPPERYVELAAEGGLDAAATTDAREAIALLAHYHSYEDKRELVADVLFSEDGSLAAQLASQFERGLNRELDTASANVSERAVGEVQFTVLDTDAFTHRYEFPPTGLVIDELHRRTREDAAVTIAVGEDDLHLRSTEALDVREVTQRAAERAPDAGLSARDARDGTIGFLIGEREAALEAVLQAVVSGFGPRA